MEHLAARGRRNLVAAAYAAATQARPQWEIWFATSPDYALESLLENRPPPEQLAAIARWLDDPTPEHEARALATVDLTKQFHWFHDDYADVWFTEPGMWAIEASSCCVLTLTGDPYSQVSPASFATLSISCALNAFRRSAADNIRQPLKTILDAIRVQFQKRGDPAS